MATLYSYIINPNELNRHKALMADSTPLIFFFHPALVQYHELNYSDGGLLLLLYILYELFTKGNKWGVHHWFWWQNSNIFFLSKWNVKTIPSRQSCLGNVWFKSPIWNNFPLVPQLLELYCNHFSRIMFCIFLTKQQEISHATVASSAKAQKQALEYFLKNWLCQENIKNMRVWFLIFLL